MSSTASNIVKTNTIDTLTSTGMTIGDASATSILLGSTTAGRTPTIVIDTLSTANTNADPAIAIGTSSSVKTIKLGIASSSVHCSSLDIKGSAMNHINNATGNVSIGDLQTDGTLNLGAGTLRTATGVINIGNPAATIAPIVIGGSSVKLAIAGSYGTSGQVLTSGGSGGTVTWATSSGGSSVRSGQIATPTYSATTPTLYTFPLPAFTGTIPNVVLTVDNGSSTSATIVIAGLASVSLTGFYYVLSSSVPAGGTLNWYATQ